MTARSEVETSRWELFRALAAVVDTKPDESRAVVRALNLPRLDAAEYTATFVLWCPPYAALHLGPEGKLGGAGADRVAGFWRAIGLIPPAEPDHLSQLLTLYACLGEAEQRAGARDAGTFQRARSALLAEHLWSWVPGYLSSVSDLHCPALSIWAGIVRCALRREVRQGRPAPLLPLALRDAPPQIGPTVGMDELLDALVAPVRSGFVLTHPSLSGIARRLGIAYRAGERRFALRAMLEQEAQGTLEGLATEAARWARRHQLEDRVEGRVARWWAGRAWSTASELAMLARSAWVTVQA